MINTLLKLLGFDSESIAKERRSKQQLRLWFSVFFLALLIPSSIISFMAYDKIQIEAQQTYKQSAESVVAQMDKALSAALAKEEQRSDTDYSFLVLEGDPGSQFLQRSILSRHPIESDLPCLLGYFQIDAEGRFSSPLLPQKLSNAASYGLTHQDTLKRSQLALEVHEILYKNNLIASASQGEVLTFSQLESEQGQRQISEKLSKEKGFKPRKSKSLPPKKVQRQRPKINTAPKVTNRKEKSYVLEEKSDPQKSFNAKPQAMSVGLFDSELEPFRVSLLDSGHFIIYRSVWRKEQRLRQGAIMSADGFFKCSILAPYLGSPVSDNTVMTVSYQNNALFRSPDVAQNVSDHGPLTSVYLSSPFHNISVSLNLREPIQSQSSQFLLVVAFLLVLALVGGTYALYSLAYRQILLAQRQQDFISSVSHELKTPITSIKMYGDILKQGWADEERQKQYYHFISDEAERLSRLIGNVLQVSQVSRNALDLNVSAVDGSELSDVVSKTLLSQLNAQGFESELIIEDDVKDTCVLIDKDAFTQVLINLIDNAIKYSVNCPVKKVEVTLNTGSKELCVEVRDYGIGIPDKELDKIFDLFYRVGDELTRSTKGTGIGLALVKELVLAMGGTIDVRSHDQGTSFRVHLPLAKE